MAYDDARLAAALATGLVENETFEISQPLVLKDGNIIRGCTFYYEPSLTHVIFVPTAIQNTQIVGCMFHEGRRTDEMTPLYDLLEECNAT